MSDVVVLGIETSNILDLIRLHVNVKGDKPGLIAYSVENEYYLGFYLPSFLKSPKLAFVYSRLSSVPPKVYTFEIDDKEIVKGGFVDVPSAIYIPVSYLSNIPHRLVFELNKNSNISFIGVDDIRSLLVIANSIYFELAEIPYLWFDVRRRTYVLNVFITDHDHAGNMFFYVRGLDYMGPYLYVSDDYSGVEVDQAPRRVERKYTQVIRVKNIPYLTDI